MRLEVGKIDKAHGVHGDVIVTLLSDRTERLDAGAVLYSNDNFEYTVARSRPHQHRFLVTFEEVNGRDQADGHRGTLLYGDPIEDADVLWVHELIGANVVDVDGTALGAVASVEENPASDLLVLENESLIPLTFLVEVHDDGTIVVDPPHGLFDPIDDMAQE